MSIWYVDQIKHLNRKRPFDVHDHAFSKILNIFDIIIKEITKLVFSSYMLLLSKLFRLMLSKLALILLSKLILPKLF